MQVGPCALLMRTVKLTSVGSGEINSSESRPRAGALYQILQYLMHRPRSGTWATVLYLAREESKVILALQAQAMLG
jgi:hypothetical protein